MDNLNEQCLQMVFAYHYAIDKGRATEGIENFADDGVFEAHGEKFTGRDAIMGFLSKREANQDRQTIHVISAPRFSRAQDGQIAIGALIMPYVRGKGGHYTCDRVLDTVHYFVETSKGWRISSRLSTPLHK